MNTLKASADFQRVSRSGKRFVFPAFIMLALKQETEDASFRLGLTVSRKVGNAVVRNRAKRRLREMARAVLAARQPGGFDVVLIAKTSAQERDFTLLQKDFLEGLEKLGVLA